jgi:hypothetical protein
MGLETILATVLPAFIPAIADGVKMIFSKITGISMGDPKNFQERLDLEKLGVEKMKALAELDRPYGTISRWVSDLRASFRYLAVGIIIIATLIYCFLPTSYQNPVVLNFLSQLSGSATFFIIGDRVYLGLKGTK